MGLFVFFTVMSRRLSISVTLRNSRSWNLPSWLSDYLEPEAGLSINLCRLMTPNSAGRRTENGEFIPLEVKVGDTIIFARYGGMEIKLEGEDYIMLRESDILAKKTK